MRVLCILLCVLLVGCGSLSKTKNQGGSRVQASVAGNREKMPDLSRYQGDGVRFGGGCGEAMYLFAIEGFSDPANPSDQYRAVAMWLGDGNKNPMIVVVNDTPPVMYVSLRRDGYVDMKGTEMTNPCKIASLVK